MKISILFKAFFLLLILKTSCQAQNSSFLNPSDLRLLNNAGFLGNIDIRTNASINTQQSFGYNSRLKTLDWNSYLASDGRLPIGKSDWIGLGGYFKGNLHNNSSLTGLPNQQELALGGSYVKVFSRRRARLDHALTLGSLIEINHYDASFDSPRWDSKFNFGLLWDAKPVHRAYSYTAHNFGISLKNLHFLKKSNLELDPFLIKLHSQHQYESKRFPVCWNIRLYGDLSVPIKNIKYLKAAHLSYNVSLDTKFWKKRTGLQYIMAIQYGLSDVEQDHYLGGALGIRINSLSIKLQYHKSLSLVPVHYTGLSIQYFFIQRLTGNMSF